MELAVFSSRMVVVILDNGKTGNSTEKVSKPEIILPKRYFISITS